MIAVIVRWKNSVRRIFALQHPRRMRHANEKHRLRIAFPRGIVYRLAGMLFEEVVDVLNDSRVAPADRPYSLGEPAYGWTKRDAILPDLPSVRRSSNVSQRPSSSTCSIRILCSCRRSI